MQRSFFFFGIIPASTNYEKLLPGITKQIKKYNQIISKNAENYISNDECAEDCVLDDFHHLSAKGNKLIFEKTAQIISTHIN